MTAARASSLATVVDLDRYPIHDAGGSGYAALVTRARRQLADGGLCQLDGFLAAEAVAATLAAVVPMRASAWRTESAHNVYFTPLGDHRDPDAVDGWRERSAKRTLAFDILPAGLPLRRLYESDDVRRFLQDALGEPALYRSIDPLDRLQVAEFDVGDELGWHFDNSEYSITVMLRPAGAGGTFEFVPAVRTADDANAPGVRAIVGGERAGVRTLDAEAGTLALFRGHHALHRVAPVTAGQSRYNAVLTYGPRPDMALSALTQELFYGRVVPAAGG